MTKVCGALVSTPPFAVPPLSLSTMVMVAEPLLFVAGVYVSVPVGLMDGPAENNPGLVLPVTWNVTVCADSSAGPVLIAVAQPLTVCAPEFSSTVWSAPLVKLGGSLTAVIVIETVAGVECAIPSLDL